MHATDVYATAEAWVSGALLIISAGALLLWRGLRGRRTDDHPLCRRCRFDLTGLPASSANCPECGADLTAARATVVGHRRRRGGLVALGLAMLLPALLVGGGAVWWTASGFDPTPFKPVWLLMREADSPAYPTADLALAELDRRSQRGDLTAAQKAALLDLAVSHLSASPEMDTKWLRRVEPGRQAGALSQAQIDAVTDCALAAQADLALPWSVWWGGWVEAARKAGQVSDARWRRYARQAVLPLTLEVRPRIEADADGLPVRLSMPEARLTFPTHFVLAELGLAFRLDGGRWVELTDGHAERSELYHDFTETGQLPIKTDSGRLAPGPHHLDVRKPLAVEERGGPARSLASWAQTFVADFVVLPPGEASATPVADRREEPKVLASVGIHGLEVGRHGPGEVQCWLRIFEVPVGMAFDVFLRDRAGREWPMETLTLKAGTYADHIFCSGTAPGLTVGRADVLLRPSLAAAEASVDVATYWDRPILLRGVTVWDGTVRPKFDQLGPDPAHAEPLPPADR